MAICSIQFSLYTNTIILHVKKRKVIWIGIYNS